ncbi:ferric reductase like transmembrane component [Pyrenophora tritici-repentis]|uniref:Ferric reductase transmembrane component n=1 Tax=Pyrenophora tritici-repentis TaxID=45151 RepID=A0A2W1GFS8_9PLEO|nr:ferric reductase like transmembrane component [Pyrenophora tritici-repentis]KAF7574100.1 Ferric-reduct multi-domain protein [Pyrenophora tritici-repentis]KAG9387063.1 ferric reductase transmembrane component [Pyrenophora tritici-repentis]KAI0570164.1 ferric reductase like transmembrane component [Pyrenophora tritici-repentis]KAI1508908.1 ferric reductase transmembrane component [Pyrenophora tritici-repentis]
MDLFTRHEAHHEVEASRYWALGYYFENLSNEQLHRQRRYLDLYGFAAEWSVWVIFVLFQVGFAFLWVMKNTLRHKQPKSPSFTKDQKSRLGWLRQIYGGYTKTTWWMQKDVIKGWNWGTRGEWIGAVAWTMWLLYLCIANTGKDYLHLTKRFGRIGASQLPIHYLLAMRAHYSPIQYLTRLSHEQIKASHQILGRIVFLLLVLHAAFYLNFFIMSGLLAKRIKNWDVIWGLISIILFSAISTTALGFVRRRNYSVFYVSHIAIANSIILSLFLHVSHIRVYVYEVIAIETLHLIFRAMRLRTYQGMLKLLSGTNLIQVRIPLPADSAVLRWSPGQHVYLSRPRRKGKAPTWYNQWFMMRRANPFTVASLPSKDRELLLIIKTLNGNTKYLGELVRSLAKGSGTTVPILPTAGGDTLTLPLALEGPYGASARLPDLLGYDRVLLVAGGIGATFIMPIYRDILGLHDNVPTDNQIRCVWTVQKLAETQWAFATNSSSGDRQDEEGVGSEDTGTHADRNSLVHGSSNIEVYVTRSAGLNLRVNATASNNFAVDSDDEGGETIEMQENDQLLDMDEQVQKPHESMLIKSGRPDLKGIVEEVFSKGVKIAVICCGPKRMIDDLRSGVEVWVNKDHEVFWHNETFDW